MQCYKTEENYKKAIEALKNGRATMSVQKEKRVKDYLENPSICLNCGSPIMDYEKRHNKFCNISCSAIFNNKKWKDVPKTKRKERGRKCPHPCMFCGKTTRNPKFCCFKCSSDFLSHKADKKIENGIIVSSRKLRNYLMNKFDNKCSKCGWGEKNPVSNTVCLDLHHIDGNHKNNVLSNVELLCPNCHSLTRTYKMVGNRSGESTRTDRK